MIFSSSFAASYAHFVCHLQIALNCELCTILFHFHDTNEYFHEFSSFVSIAVALSAESLSMFHSWNIRIHFSCMKFSSPGAATGSSASVEAKIQYFFLPSLTLAAPLIRLENPDISDESRTSELWIPRRWSKNIKRNRSQYCKSKMTKSLNRDLNDVGRRNNSAAEYYSNNNEKSMAKAYAVAK